MRVSQYAMSSLADVIQRFRGLIGILQAQSHWLGGLLEDPASPVDGDVWLRSDQPDLRLRVNGKTYKATLTEV